MQQQQIDLLQNNGREIEMLKNDQVNLQEKYYKLEKNFFEIEDVNINKKRHSSFIISSLI